MTYVTKKEKLFDLPEQENGSSSVSLKNSETRLTQFPYMGDRTCTFEECQRFKHLYSSGSGREVNVSKSSSFKYIPFDVLLAILMAEKDAYIQELLDRQNEKSCCREKLYKAEGYEDSDDDRDALIRKDAEMVSLKNKIISLESQLEDYRDTLTKAMHKLENMDAIMSENSLLREKLANSEETIKCLEEKKKELERELHYIKQYSESESDLEEKHWRTSRFRDEGHYEKIIKLSSERDILLMQIEKLQKELEKSRINSEEMELLKKVTESTSNSLEEISKENECYKKKLETMKCLEKHIEELKKQAQTLTEKYKREAQKSNDHLKQISLNTKELQIMREERDRLQKRVEELLSYESQFLSLQSKLHQVEIILDENEMLNKKLIQLDKLELENEHLKMKVEQLQNAEVQAAEDKEKIKKLQSAVVSQDEEIKKMLWHIEDISKGYIDKNEINQLKVEIEDKNGKLRQYERQVAEIPILESEIEELRNKLQKCIDDFKIDKDLLKRLQEELEACQNRCRELEEIAVLYPVNPNLKAQDSIMSTEGHNVDQNLTFENEEENASVYSKQNVESQSEIKHFKEQCTEAKILSNDRDTFYELLELEDRNKVLKAEVEHLRSRLSEINLDDFVHQINEMRELLRFKEEKIAGLEFEIKHLQKKLSELEDLDELKQNQIVLEREMNNLYEINNKMKNELEAHRLSEEHIKEIKKKIQIERAAKNLFLGLIKETEDKLLSEQNKMQTERTLAKLQLEEINLAKYSLNAHIASEINYLKDFADLSKKLIKELKTENQILQELYDYAKNVERKDFKALIKKLRAKVKVLKSLSKPQLQAEYECLQEKFKIMVKEVDHLITEINDLKLALDSERDEKDYLKKELLSLQAEITACVSAGSDALDRELSTRDILIEKLKKELANNESELEDSYTKIQTLEKENETWSNNYNNLKSEEKSLKDKINQLSLQLEEKKNLEKEISELLVQVQEQRQTEIKLSQISAELEKQKSMEDELAKLQNQLEQQKATECENIKLKSQIEEQEKTIEIKNKKESEYLEEINNLKNHSIETNNELAKLKILEQDLGAEIKELHQLLNAKEEEINKVKKLQSIMQTELNKRNSEIEVLRSRLFEKSSRDKTRSPYQADFSEKYILEEKYSLEEKFAIEEALRKIENELDKLKTKLDECRKMEDEMIALRNKRDSLLKQMESFEKEIELLKKKLIEFEDLKCELEYLRSEKHALENNEDEGWKKNSLNYQKELDLCKKENEKLNAEKEGLLSELSKAEGLLEVSRKLHKTVSQIQMMSCSAEFFTPPALPSPRPLSPKESEVVAEDVIPLKIHEKELSELENRFKMKLQKLKEANTKKVKKLTSYHEKDARCRCKAFHESINSVKSSYENGIRKLVEKHKISIVKLQELHEEEVQELNKNYETQMGAMEKQNQELITDLRMEASEKCRQMTEMHVRELREMEMKYEEIIKEKDLQIETVTLKAETCVNQNANDLQEVHKQTVESLTQFHNKTMCDAEEKHNKELNKYKKNYMKKIELMKNKYEALLVEERKKYEEQLEKMLSNLKKGHPDGVVTNTIKRNFIQRKITTANPQLEFLEVLQKIINEGLESLTFEELILVHSKTCFVPESISDRDERGGGELNDSIGDGCQHKGLMEAKKEELLRRIFTLEREIIVKQLETHEAIVNMEASEKYKIQELKNALLDAQQKNSELKRLISNQSKLHTDMKIEKYMMDRQVSINETNVVEKIKELEREKAEKRCLEEELQKEKENVKNLTSLLESEKERFKNLRKRDSDYVESIRQRLEEALNHEQIMESQLDYEARFRSKLETELQSLQKSFNLITDVPFGSLPVDSKAIKNFKNFDQCETTKDEIHNRNKNRKKTISKVAHNL